MPDPTVTVPDDPPPHDAHPTITSTNPNIKGSEPLLSTYKNSDEDFLKWDPTAKIFFLGHSFWILKELFWVLLLTPVAFSFGGLSFCCITYAVVARLRAFQKEDSIFKVGITPTDQSPQSEKQKKQKKDKKPKVPKEKKVKSDKEGHKYSEVEEENQQIEEVQQPQDTVTTDNIINTNNAEATVAVVELQQEVEGPVTDQNLEKDNVEGIHELEPNTVTNNTNEPTSTLKLERRNSIRAEVLIGFIHISWLGANIVDMIATLGYDEPPEETPTYSKSFVSFLCDGFDYDTYDYEVEDSDVSTVNSNSNNNNIVVSSETYSTLYPNCASTNSDLLFIARIAYSIPICLWILFTSWLMFIFIKPPRFVAQGSAFQTVLIDGGWLTFWIIKDFFWSFDTTDSAEGSDQGLSNTTFTFAVIAWSVHFLLLLLAFMITISNVYLWDGITQEEQQRLQENLALFTSIKNGTADLPMVSYVLWSIGALLWLIMEEKYEESLTIRYVVAGFFGTSFIVFIAGYRQIRARSLKVKWKGEKWWL